MVQARKLPLIMPLLLLACSGESQPAAPVIQGDVNLISDAGVDLDVTSADTSAGADSATADVVFNDSEVWDTNASDTAAFDTLVDSTDQPDVINVDTMATDAPSINDTHSGAADASSNLLPSGLGTSPCTLPGENVVAGGIKLVGAFANLQFGALTFLTHPHDGTDRIVVVERSGKVWAFENSPSVTSKSLVLDISSKVSTAGEGGLLSVAFHPKFKANGRLFLSYTSIVNGSFSSVFSEVSVKQPTLVADSSSEKVLLTIKQPHTNHDGGQILFDKLGKLIIGMGDGGAAGDPLNAGQDTSSLLGAILRIDVDDVPVGKSYGIPKDNPNKSNWLPEMYAIGARNPWRMSLDRNTGVIWAGDVGQNKWEEITTVRSGANLGWRILEGTHCYKPSFGCNKSGMHMPVFEYDHSKGKSVTGGYVYRGSKFPSLQGVYVFGDFVSKRYWGLYQKDGQWQGKVLLNSSNIAPASFGEDRAGELYVVQLWGSPMIAKVEVSSTPPSGNPPPQKLSQTGCFTNLKTLTPAAGVVPYKINAPLWSDGAAKARFVVPPAANGAGVATLEWPKTDYDLFTWPEGTIAIKHFGLGTGAPGTSDNTPVETRFMVKGPSGWVFWTYSWNAQGNDATLELTGSTKSYPVAGTTNQQVWVQPSVADCTQCHGAKVGPVTLGLSPAQLNGDFAYLPNKSANQLAVWSAAGLFSGGYKGQPAQHEAMPPQPWIPPLKSVQIDEHARAWLHTQCASCHQPSGASQADFDVRMNTPLSQAKICDVPPGFGDGGVTGAKLIVPGKPAQSVIYTRIASQPGGQWFMPHIGVSLPHQAGIELIKSWIEKLSACPTSP
ncbi:MAG TPA: hypothetical protein DCQ06_01020 [Myxococcales bacterium]|nr:hypothetical protein [Myxococcales bacterium]